MKLKVHVFQLLFALVMLVSCAGISWGATITGSVSNYIGKTGRVYLTVLSQGQDQGCGVSIAGPGAFTINGVSPGTYQVLAFMDTQGAGVRHANDPVGYSSEITINSGDSGKSAGTITLSATSLPVAAPQIITYRGNGGNMVLWGGSGDDDELPVADKYTVSWSTSSGGPVQGSRDVLSGEENIFFHTGAAANLYYQVTAVVVGGTSASTSWTPVTTTTGVTVSGTATLTGVTSPGPLVMILADDTSDPPLFLAAAVTNPASSQAYSITNVPPGTYQLYAMLDMNNNGFLDYGDIEQRNSETMSPIVTVASVNVPVPEVVDLPARNADAAVRTRNWKSSSYEGLSIGFELDGQQKQPVNVSVSGPGLTGVTDIGLSKWGEFSVWPPLAITPEVGDEYTFTVTYADTTAQSIVAPVTAILDSFPTPVTPEGAVPYSSNATPTFTWTTPASLPAAPYSYELWVNDQNDQIWSPDMNFPAGQTSVQYNFDDSASLSALTDGEQYTWQIAVNDRYGNSAQYQAQFVPTSSPIISGFSPASGLAGTTVTISGNNFDPVAANNSITFGGASTAATAVTATTLTVTVPPGATSAPIAVSAGGNTGFSDSTFVVTPSISLTGIVKFGNESAVAGARIELLGNPSVNVVSAADGSFTLAGLPGDYTPFRLLITKSGYLPVYVGNLEFAANTNVTAHPYFLYTAAELGLSAGQSAVFAKFINGADFVSAISGVTATALGSTPFDVSYYDSVAKSYTGSATDSSGIAAVFNVASPNNYFSLSAAKSGWVFSSLNVYVPSSAVVELGIIGTPPAAPAISGFSPLKGKAGTMVTIDGSNFMAAPSDNIVKFNGVTASVSSATENQIWVNVPPGATTGVISVATEGGTATSGTSFITQNTLTATLNGTGDGSVSSVTPGVSFACTDAVCSADFDYNTNLTLSATPGAGSLFSTWAGACTGSGTCALTLNSDKSVTATFNSAPLVKVGGASYSDPQSAYSNPLTVSGNVVQALEYAFVGNLTFNRDVAVTLEGGYDSSYSVNNGYTSLQGVLSFVRGSVVIERIVVR